jgi:hypothetical protein
VKESIFEGMSHEQLLIERRRLTSVRGAVESEVSNTMADAQARANILTLIERQLEDLDSRLN